MRELNRFYVFLPLTESKETGFTVETKKNLGLILVIKTKKKVLK